MVKYCISIYSISDISKSKLHNLIYPYHITGNIKKIQFDDAAAWMQGFQDQHGRMPLEEEFYADSQHRFNAIEAMLQELKGKLKEMSKITSKISDKKDYCKSLDEKITNIGNSILILLKDDNKSIDMVSFNIIYFISFKILLKIFIY
jgi:hypothetical protein